jgi:hypothetical protein
MSLFLLIVLQNLQDFFYKIKQIIKHDVAKIIVNYNIVLILSESKIGIYRYILKCFGFVQNQTPN